MLCAHLDVVPTPDLHLWKTADGKPIDPFAGEIHPFGQVIDANGRPATSTTAADGESLRNGPSVWGRGAIDNKHNVVMQLQAVEEALASGTLRPQRTVYLAYGHDEEIGGKQAKQAKQASKRTNSHAVDTAIICLLGDLLLRHQTQRCISLPRQANASSKKSTVGCVTR
jgi:acetylornithine deacetylase/succinyl-diaminopimelate desuccinylase-like protein